ncbi:DUF6507 family protein [Curtobacterium sp. Leaf261]|uniref:DUF6507 family protein n=1 Tax=Curtobacterium sp. Leaf261 TaxID=1736311 RepID=UPI000B209459|nr:DUF6507 family protein [Curtobacterium sp. Leaf261]
MTTWSVDVAGVRDVVVQEASAAEQIAGAGRQLGDGLRDAVDAVAASEDVRTAMSLFARRHDAAAGRIEAHIGAVLGATGDVVAAIVLGDDEMAANALRAAAHPTVADLVGAAR